MKRVAELLDEMLRAGVIQDYAVFGAVAQMRYTEAVATFDAGVLVAVPEPEVLDVLAPLHALRGARLQPGGRGRPGRGLARPVHPRLQPADGCGHAGGGNRRPRGDPASGRSCRPLGLHRPQRQAGQGLRASPRAA